MLHFCEKEKEKRCPYRVGISSSFTETKGVHGTREKPLAPVLELIQFMMESDPVLVRPRCQDLVSLDAHRVNRPSRFPLDKAIQILAKIGVMDLQHHLVRMVAHRLQQVIRHHRQSIDPILTMAHSVLDRPTNTDNS